VRSLGLVERMLGKNRARTSIMLARFGEIPECIRPSLTRSRRRGMFSMQPECGDVCVHDGGTNRK